MDELDLASIKKRSITGVLALTSRTLFLQIINFASMFLLTIFLNPAVFGVYFVVIAIVNFLNYFSDIGLAAALIQKKEKLTQADLKTTFTIQQALVIFLVILSLSVSSHLAVFYNLDAAGLWLFRALVIAFFLASLKTIPSVLLERKLDFNRLIIPQIGEAIIFNLVAVFLAWKGAGIASFSWAVLARGISGLILIYLVSPWLPGLALNRASARKLLSFGIPFQINSLLALVKDDLLVVFLGKVLPFAQVGFIGWAQKWAFMPLRFIMDSVNKVTFPAYSRVQDNVAALRTGIEEALFAVCFLTFPTLVGLVLLALPLIEILPRYTKWEPALIAFYLFCLQAVFSSISTTLTNTLNATGRVKTTLKLMVLWTALTWIFTPILIYFWGFNGVALAAVFVSLTVFLPIWLVRKITYFTLWENVGKPLLGALIMGGVLYFLMPLFPLSFISLVLIIFFGAIIYLGVMFLIAQKRIIRSVNLVLEALER